VVANKTDVISMDALKPEDRALIENLGKSAGVEVGTPSLPPSLPPSLSPI